MKLSLCLCLCFTSFLAAKPNLRVVQAPEDSPFKPGDQLVSWGSDQQALDSWLAWFDLVINHLPQSAQVITLERANTPQKLSINEASALLELWVSPASLPEPLPEDIATAIERATLLSKDDPVAAVLWFNQLIGQTKESQQREQIDLALAETLESLKDPKLQASLRFLLSETLYRTRDFAAAQAHRDRALTLLENQPVSLLNARLHYRSGREAKRTNDLETAKAKLEQALGIFETIAPNSLAKARTLVALGDVLQRSGKPDLAGPLFFQAHTIIRQIKPDSDEEGEVLVSMGIAAWYRSDLDKAASFYRQAIDLFEKREKMHPSYIRALANLGIIAKNRGEYAAAERWYRQALELLNKHDPQNRYRGPLNNNLGNLAISRGDLETAAHFLEKALEIENAIRPGSLSSAYSLTNLGRVAHLSGNFDKGEHYLQQSLDIRQKLAPEGYDVTVSQFFLGELYLDTNQLEKAKTNFEQALTIREKLVPGSLFLAECHYSLGVVAERRGDWQAAESHHREALRIRDAIAPQNKLTAKSWLGLGRVLQYKGDFDAALDAFETALQRIESSLSTLGGTPLARAKFVSVEGEHYRAPLQLLVTQKDPVKAFAYLERYYMASYLNQLADRELLLDLPPQTAQQLSRLDNQLDQIIGKIHGFNADAVDDELIKLKFEYRELRETRASLLEDIKQASPQYASLYNPSIPKLDDVIASLPSDTVIVAYLIDEKQSYAFTISKASGIHAQILPVSRNDLASKIDDLRNFINKPTAKSSQTFMLDQAQELYDLLIAPLRQQLAGHQNIQLIADGPLNRLPFGTLYGSQERGASASYLVSQFTLSLLPFASAKQADQNLNQAAMRVVAFGDPDYPGAQVAYNLAQNTQSQKLQEWLRGNELGPLPFSKHELEKLAELYPDQIQLFRGKQALEANYKQLSGPIELLHFSCHAYLDPQFPLSSALLLTPQDGRQDGLLQAREIIEQTNAQLQTVILSACETGRGDDSLGLLGLTRAFHLAGAQHVIASQWKVSDLSTSLLMRHFHQQLSQGQPEAQALRNAQLEMLRLNQAQDETRHLAHPFYWAAFQCYSGSGAGQAKL